MTGHKVGGTVVLVGTIVEIQGTVAMVRVDRSFPEGGVIAVRLGALAVEVPPDEDLIREAMTEARDHPGRTITR
jgi:hypothetical protein